MPSELHTKHLCEMIQTLRHRDKYRWTLIFGALWMPTTSELCQDCGQPLGLRAMWEIWRAHLQGIHTSVLYQAPILDNNATLSAKLMCVFGVHASGPGTEGASEAARGFLRDIALAVLNVPPLLL